MNAKIFNRTRWHLVIQGNNVYHTSSSSARHGDRHNSFTKKATSSANSKSENIRNSERRLRGAKHGG